MQSFLKLIYKFNLMLCEIFFYIFFIFRTIYAVIYCIRLPSVGLDGPSGRTGPTAPQSRHKGLRPGGATPSLASLLKLIQ